MRQLLLRKAGSLTVASQIRSEYLSYLHGHETFIAEYSTTEYSLQSVSRTCLSRFGRKDEGRCVGARAIDEEPQRLACPGNTLMLRELG
jgi:hypothetical protein